MASSMSRRVCLVVAIVLLGGVVSATTPPVTIQLTPDPDPDAQGGRLGFAPEALQELGIDPGGDDFQVALDSCQENLRGVVGGGHLSKCCFGVGKSLSVS